MDQKRYKAGFALLLMVLTVGYYMPSAQAAEFCSDAYSIDVTLPNQARWDMCWEHRAREGIVLHKIHYTPRNGVRRMILNQAALAQIHVPYDDNGARYHDISDYGLGAGYMASLTAADCPGGELLWLNAKAVLCKTKEARGSAYEYGSDHLQGDAFSLFSVSKIGAYNYIPVWRFMDDGAIEPGVGATGALQRYGSAALEQQGWLVSENQVGIAHLHNFFWKLDFDLGASSRDDYVEELNFTSAEGRTSLGRSRFNKEAARTVNPATLRRWRVADGNLTNSKGLPMSYEIRLHQSEHQDSGPDSEPFTQNDFYVTKQKSCELFASHNPVLNGCSSNLAAFVNNESVAGEDIVVWPSTTFYHMPRAEDAPHMDAHWSYISITPRDWHDNNPLSDADDTVGSTRTDGAAGDAPDTLFADDFELDSAWTRNPQGTDTATAGLWEAGVLEPIAYQASPMQRTATSGSRALATGPKAGASAGSFDLDGGISSIRSPAIDLPAGVGYTLNLSYYFAHLWNAANSDFLRVSVEDSAGSKKVLLEEQANLNTRPAQWTAFSADLRSFAGKRIYLLVEAGDQGAGSVVEAAVDNVRLVKNASTDNGNGDGDTGGGTVGQSVFVADFDDSTGWTLNPNGTDTASSGLWQSGAPQATAYQSTTMQRGTASSGNAALLTGLAAGTSVGAYDLDGGTTSIRSPLINLPAGQSYRLTMDYYFAHLWNSSAADSLRVTVENPQGLRQVVLEKTGSASNRAAEWESVSADLSQFAGSSIHLLVEATDGGAGSIVEAAVDNIRITSP